MENCYSLHVSYIFLKISIRSLITYILDTKLDKTIHPRIIENVQD